MKRRAIKTLLSLSIFAVTSTAGAITIGEEQSGIYQTKHNLLRGIVLPKGTEEPELCIWCHIPHDSLSGDTSTPKWLKYTSDESSFNVYGIDSNATSGSGKPMPDVMVRVCLTCHDGVNAPDIALFSESAPQKFNNNTASLSTDPISKDAFVHSHPVGKEYAPYSPGGNRASLRPESHILKDWIGAKTIQDLVSEGVVGCTSCHDPHTTNAQFLRTRNSDSKLCKGCHNK